MDSIRVGVRVRPLLKRETESGQKNNWTVSSNCIAQKSSNVQPYCFDNVFHGDVKTVDIFNTMALPIVHSVMEGFNGTIFVYGQTSSGKTHTMMGSSDDPGIIPLTIHEIFSYIERCVSREFILRLSYLEIYNETLTDLLNPENKNLKIRENTEHTVSVHGLTECGVTLASEVVDLLCYGDQNRVTGETNMNERSSRSHTIVTMAIESRERDEEEEGEGGEGGGRDGPVKVSSINLVDLAGSERVSTNGSEWTNVRFKEGTFINLSLLTLGNVIAKLSEGSSAHIPFRDSKLTRILQPSLGGNAKTCIICTITPASVEETHSTLKFAGRAKQIQNKPIVNEVLLGEAALMKKLKSYQKENDELKHKLAEQRLPEEDKAKLALQLADSEREKNELEQKIKSLQEIIVRSTVTEALNPKGTTRDRRRTVCPALLGRGGQDVPQSLHPTISTPAGNSRHALGMFSPLFSPHYDKNSFEKHLDSLEVTPVGVEKRHVKFASRPSFIPNVQCATLEMSDGLESTAGSSNAVSSATAGCAQMVDTSAQTELLCTSTATTPIRPEAQTTCVPNMDASFRCEHRQKLLLTMETLEIAQFECDENHIVLDHLRQDNAKLQGDVAELKTALDCHISKCSNQEEMINGLQLQLVSARTVIQEKQAQIDQYERECHVMTAEVNELKQHLESFKNAVEHSGKSSGQQETNSVVEALKTELEAVRCKADQDAKHFQVCYEQKVLEVNRGNLKVSALEEKLQDAYAELMSFESKAKELSKAADESKIKMQQYVVTLEEKEELISSLQNAVTAANKRNEDEAKKIRTQYEGYLSQAESYARDLQAKLNGRTSSPESKQTIAKLKAEMQELQLRNEEKDATATALQAKVEELNSLLQSTTDQLEEKLSESTVMNKSTTPRRWGAFSFEEEAAECAREEEMQRLTEQLKTVCSTLEEKEAEAAIQEGKLKELCSLLDNANALLKEKETCVNVQEQVLSELKLQLENSKAALEELKAVDENKVVEQAAMLQELKASYLKKLEEQATVLQELKASYEKKLEEQATVLQELKASYGKKFEEQDAMLQELRAAYEKKIEEQATMLQEKEIALARQEESIGVLTSQVETVIKDKDGSEESRGVSTDLQHVMDQLHVKEATVLQLEQCCTDVQSQLECYKSKLEEKETAYVLLEEELKHLKEHQEQGSFEVASQSKLDELTSSLESIKSQLIEKESLLCEEEARVSELSSELQKQVASLQYNESVRLDQEKKIEELQEEYERATIVIKELRSTCSGNEKKIEELQDTAALLQGDASLVGSLRSKMEDMSSLLQEKEALVTEQIQKTNELSSQLNKALQDNETMAAAQQDLQSQCEHLVSLMREKEDTVDKQEKQILELRTQLRTSVAALEEKEKACNSLQKEVDDNKAQVREASKRATTWEAECKRKSEEIDELCGAKMQLMSEKKDLLLQIDTLQLKVENAVTELEALKAVPQVTPDQLKSTQKALEENMSLVANLQSRVKELTDKLEERKAACSVFEKSINDYKMAATDLQAQLTKATERSDVWEAEFKKKSEEADDLCRVERQLTDEKYELEEENTALKSKLESVTADVESMKRLPEMLEVAQKALKEKTLSARSLQSRVDELSNELEERKAACSLFEKSINDYKMAATDLQAQLTKATECSNVWEAEFKKKSEEADDLCRAEKQLLDEKEELLLQLDKLKSLSRSKETEGSNQFERYQSQINELKSALQSSRKEMEAQLTKATERGDVWEAEFNKKSEEVDDLCRVERQLMDEKYELEEENTALKSKLELAVKELEEMKTQQTLPSDHAIAPNEEYSYKARIQELQKDNEYLRSKLQSEALKPTGLTASSIANDGSGFVTGVAYYEMQASKRAMEKENEKLLAKLEKLKTEISTLQAALQTERESVKKYRNERNIFRVKYDKIKGVDSTASNNTAGGGSPPEKSEPVVAAVESSEPASEKCPTPRRSRKSILSFPTNGQMSHDVPSKAGNVRAGSNLPSHKAAHAETLHCLPVPHSVKSTNLEAHSGTMATASTAEIPPVPLVRKTTQASNQVVVKDNAVTTTSQDSSLLSKERYAAAPAAGTAKLLPDGPIAKVAHRQPLTSMNSDQSMKRKDEDKGHRKSVLTFPPDTCAANPYMTKKAKVEEDLLQNPQSANTDANECKTQ